MIQARFVPLRRWPGAPTKSPRNSPFFADWRDTLQLLEREIKHVDGKNIVIEAPFEDGQIRLDGWPLSKAVPRGYAVILSMTAKHGSLSYPCDKFSHWQDNLRAIALSMEALRKVDRYGVTRGGEQYRGFAALPPAQPIDHLAVIARVIGTTVDTAH